MSEPNPDYVPTHFQYRVCWKRKGGRWVSKNFERQSSAERLSHLLATADHLHYRCDHLGGLFSEVRCIEPIEEGPRIDRRKVGNWQ